MTTIAELLSEARVSSSTGPAHNATRLPSQLVWGEGSDRINVLEEIDREHLHDVVAAAKAYAAVRFDAGLGWIDGPLEYGGRRLSVEHAIRSTSSSRTTSCPTWRR